MEILPTSDLFFVSFWFWLKIIALQFKFVRNGTLLMVEAVQLIPLISIVSTIPIVINLIDITVAKSATSYDDLCCGCDGRWNYVLIGCRLADMKWQDPKSEGEEKELSAIRHKWNIGPTWEYNLRACISIDLKIKP